MSRRGVTPTGAYSEDYAASRATAKATKRHRRDEALFRSLTSAIPFGANIADIGAGGGTLAATLREHGWSVDAWDGCPLPAFGVAKWDLTQPHPDRTRWYRWGLFIEVGEHVPELHQQQLAKHISQIVTEGLVISYATPGQPGRGHVSCKTPEEVLALFAPHGWRMNEGATNMARHVAGGGWQKKLLVLNRKGAYEFGTLGHTTLGKVCPLAQARHNHPGRHTG